jgi:cytochrome c oxidase cbb3-type subunit 2
MPSYKHLFAEGDTRGEDLVAYLMSLGQASMADRAAFTRSWVPAEPIAGSAHDGQRLFERSCSPCHGLEGAADGPLSKTLFRPAMDLTKGSFFYVSAEATPDEQTLALARIVKFGLPGTNMAGHEYFTDKEVANIVAYLQSL